MVHCSTMAPTGLAEELKHFFPPLESMGSGTPVSLCQETICFRHDPSDMILPQREKNHALLPPGAEMLYVLLIRRLSSQSSLRHLPLYLDSTLQHCISPSFQHTGGRAHFFCNSGECHLHKKSSSKSFYSITNVTCIWKTEVISLDWK